MHAAGFVLAAMRKLRSRAHPPMILAHSLTSDFFGIEERAAYWPDFESFTTWPATARLLCELRDLDKLAGQSSVDHFGHWHDPTTRKIILCTKQEAERAKREAKQR